MYLFPTLKNFNYLTDYFKVVLIPTVWLGIYVGVIPWFKLSGLFAMK